MTKEEIQDLARKYHKPGGHIKKEWHPIYQKECEKINRKELEKKIEAKYSNAVLTIKN